MRLGLGWEGGREGGARTHVCICVCTCACVCTYVGKGKRKGKGQGKGKGKGFGALKGTVMNAGSYSWKSGWCNDRDGQKKV